MNQGINLSPCLKLQPLLETLLGCFFVGQVRIIGVEAGGEHGPWLPVSWAKSPMGGNIMSSFEEFLWWKMISERWFLYILRSLFGVFLGGQWSISLDFSQNQHCLEMFLGMVFRIHVNTSTEGHVARHTKGPNRSRTAGQLELVENHHLSHWWIDSAETSSKKNLWIFPKTKSLHKVHIRYGHDIRHHVQDYTTLYDWKASRLKTILRMELRLTSTLLPWLRVQ